jgi:hypothetical protein
MKNNEENSVKREVHEEIKSDLSNGNITTHKTTSTVPSTTVNDAKKADYHEGYVQGEVSENHRKSKDQTVKDNDNAARGLLLGIILASVVGLILGTTYFLNRRDEAPTLVPLVVPVPKANQPSAPSNTTKIIEKEKTIIEKLIPVPQASPVQKASPAEKVAPSPQVNPAPNINITVPNSQRQEAPAQPVAPAPSAPNNIKITLPKPQKEPTSTTPTPAPQSSTAPSPTESTPAPQSSTAPSPTESTPTPESSPVPSPTPPNPPPKTSSPTQNNDASGVDGGVDSQK